MKPVVELTASDFESNGIKLKNYKDKYVLIKCTNNKEYHFWINVNFCKHTVWLKHFKIQ